MAMFKFVQSILAGRPIEVYNCGALRRDFTYIDDIVEGVIRTMLKPPTPTESADNWSTAPYRVFNIGNNRPVELMELIQIIEDKLRLCAKLKMLPMQPGDVYETCADLENLWQQVGYQPPTSIRDGVSKFVDWYLGFYGSGARAAENDIEGPIAESRADETTTLREAFGS